MCLRGCSFYLKNCKQTAEKCKQIFENWKKTAAYQTHFRFTNMGSEELSFRVTTIWKGKLWFGSPCMYININEHYIYLEMCRFRNFMNFMEYSCNFFIHKCLTLSSALVKCIVNIFPSVKYHKELKNTVNFHFLKVNKQHFFWPPIFVLHP